MTGDPAGFNESRLATVIAVVVTAIVTLEKRELIEHAGRVPLNLSEEIDRGLRQVLGL